MKSIEKFIEKIILVIVCILLMAICVVGMLAIARRLYELAIVFLSVGAMS